MTGTAARITEALAGRYTAADELGAGGMATVYPAHDAKHNRKVAVRVLRPELAAVLASRSAEPVFNVPGRLRPRGLPPFP